MSSQEESINSAEINYMNQVLRDRVNMTTICSDCEYIPKVADAGNVSTLPDGTRVQTMHNGLLIKADAYPGPFITEIIRRLRGHHEPQEEKVFYEVLPYITHGSVMIELGSYWAYYSLWFQKTVLNARSYLIEPDEDHLKLGSENFALNNVEGTFLHAYIGRKTNLEVSPPVISVDDFVRDSGIKSVAILHCDIQGNEYEMLRGAEQLLRRKNIRFTFVSTHGHKVHAGCLHQLRKFNYKIIVEHTPGESFSEDGLIVATADKSFNNAIGISRRKQGIVCRLKSLMTRSASLVPKSLGARCFG
jgi:hypothetical protein